MPLRRTSHLPFLIVVLCAVVLVMLGLAPKQQAPERIRVEVRAFHWQRAVHTNGDIRIIFARPGDDLVDSTLYPEGTWVGGVRHSPLTLGTILGPDRAWIRMTRGGFAGELYSFDSARDSVLVSTTWRTFGTMTTDGGFGVRARTIADTAALVRPGDNTLQIRSWRRPPPRLQEVLQTSEVAGVFRMLHVTPMASKDTSSFAFTFFALSFRAEDVWLGSAIRRGDTLRAVNWGEGTDSTWSPNPGATPMRVGHAVILFLSHHMNSWFPDQWSFSAFGGGYGLFDESERLVFSYPVRGEPVDRFRRRVEWEAWRPRHPFEGRVFGRVFADSTNRPLIGARIDLAGLNRTTTVDSTGWFELIGVPIGQQLLRVTGHCPAASSIVEITDEFSDTLEVLVPCARGSAR